jgi:ubiquinone/menaquinone biosynthesis C-methylase UbiE
MDDRARRPLERLADRLPALTRGRVLDVGCGDGRFLPARGVGLDVDPERLRSARERSPFVVRADAQALPFPDRTFDTVYALRALNDIGEVDRALAEAARVLRPDGRLLVYTRARPAEGDRLDRWNGAARLGRHFAAVSMEVSADDERAALFIADRPR